MNEIICPHCGTAFKVDEAAYADILKQVRDSEFKQQLHDRLELAEKDKLNAIELAKNELSREMQKAAAAKDAQIQELKASLDLVVFFSSSQGAMPCSPEKGTIRLIRGFVENLVERSVVSSKLNWVIGIGNTNHIPIWKDQFFQHLHAQIYL